MKSNLLISCEHGGNRLPQFAINEVSIPQGVLESHRGYDLGALEIALKLGQAIKVKPIVNKVTRLLIDYNRSLHNQKIWSPYTQNISPKVRGKLIADYSQYRKDIESNILKSTVHLSVHSFTPVMNGEKRNCEFALLYDPARKAEKKLAFQIKSKLKSLDIP